MVKQAEMKLFTVMARTTESRMSKFKGWWGLTPERVTPEWVLVVVLVVLVVVLVILVVVSSW